ncbi:MAG: hypothetical protein ACTSWZ_00745 [Candidatus Heimdallarchaeaceae archaeon]
MMLKKVIEISELDKGYLVVLKEVEENRIVKKTTMLAFEDLLELKKWLNEVFKLE